MLTKPSVARGKVIFVSENEGQTFKKVAGAPIELSSVIVTGGNSACLFRILDVAALGPGNSYNLEDGFAVGARSSESISFCPPQPIPMKKGCIIVCEQGEGSNAECMVAVNGN